MKQIPAHTQKVTLTTVRQPIGLYRLVFQSVWSSLFVILLITSFFLQTFERALANEVVEESATSLSPLITDDLIERVESDAVPIAIERAETPTEDVLIPPEITEAEPVNQPDPTTIPIDTSPPPPQIEDGTSVPESPPDIGTTTLDETLTEEISPESLLVDTGTSTPTLTVESDQMIQFNKNSCVAVEDGSFYCQKASTSVAVADEGLYSLPDADGDLEIYLKRAGELTQLTRNTVDDASPYYDPASDTIVWHRVIDERYQIMVMDVASGEETQLTDTSTNNMEPFRSDNIIVWQHWENNAWQIMFFDGQTIAQLTDTVEHNLAPVVRNGLVVWHRITNGVKTIEVYDISTASFMTIEDEGGGTVTNPRMVLVFDSTMDNGDTVTKGYDLVTGEITEFETEPAPLPEEIPTPDPIEEARALVQSKSTGRESGENIDTDLTGSTTPMIDPPIDAVASSSSVTAGTTLTLDLSSATSSMVTELPQVAPLPADYITDVVVPPYQATSSQDIDTVVE